MDAKIETASALASSTSPPRDVVERLTERLTSANTQMIYGNPVERGGTTVIPVARLRYGFGTGAGRKLAEGHEGTGAGGGADVTPVGFIEVRGDGARFRRIDVGSPALKALGVGVALWMLSRLVRDIVAVAR
jgi:uncharacterized spore protein YtfJ